ncbi:MAG: pentapeptide repeat-containing protein [bacterium]|nr:pentapeptide repeat-containing protein [bacterium]
MRSLAVALALVSALSLPSSALAASYLRTDGSIVDPILSVDAGAHPYAGIDLAPGADLHGVDLQGAQLYLAALGGANLTGSILRGADLVDADLTHAALAGADLRDADLTVARFAGADLTGATLGGDNGFGAHLSDADLTGVVWTDSLLDEVVLNGTILSFGDLRGWRAWGIGAQGAAFDNANLDGARLGLIAPGADFTNATLRGVAFEQLIGFPAPSLRDALLVDSDLAGASFSAEGGFGQIDLEGADLSGAILRDVVGLGNTSGAAFYDVDTDFANAWVDLGGTIPFDPVAAGWTLVPEPGTAVLIGLGLVGLARSRPRRAPEPGRRSRARGPGRAPGRESPRS